MHDTLDYIIQNTNNITLIWKQAATMSLLPNSVSKKIDSAMLDWLRDLTKTLRLWTDKGFSMTSGELILARVNLGSVVESWLKFFYCVHNVDYHKTPLINKRGVIEPNNLSFDELKRYSDYFALRKALYRTLESTISLHGKHQRAARKALLCSRFQTDKTHAHKAAKEYKLNQ